MKQIHKLMSAVVALLMVLGLSLSGVSAEESGQITINPAFEDQTYTLYKLFNATITEDGENAAYTVDPAWDAFKTNKAFTDNFEIVGENVIAKAGFKGEANADARATFAKDALAFAKANGIAPVNATGVWTQTSGTGVQPVTGTMVYSGLAYGYYLVGTTTGSLVSLDTTTPIVTIEDKNNVPPITKTYDNTAEKGVGDIVTFTVTLGKTKGVAEKAIITDTMTEGLKIYDLPKSVKFGTVEATLNTDYKIERDDTDPEKKFILTLLPDGLKKLSEADLTLTYRAEVTSAAISKTDMSNTATLEFGNNPNAGSVTRPVTPPKNVNLFKHAKDDKGLEGAVFTLTRTDHNLNEPVYFKLNAMNRYEKVAENTEGADIHLTSLVNGNIQIEGLAVGTYTLTETTAPLGYNKLTESLSFSIDAEGNVTFETDSVFTVGTGTTPTIKILNTAGQTLPGTGGMGTTMFYIAGGLLVVGSAVLLVSKKRMDA